MIKKIFNICSTVLFVLLMLTTITLVAMKFMGESYSFFGYNAYYVLTGSMEPEIMAGDVIFSKSVDDVSELKVGDVITYNGEVGAVKGKSVTHKIIEIRDENGKLIFVTQGVANPAADPPITSEQIVSKMVCKSGLLGEVVSLVNNKYGFLVIIILPLAVFLTSEVITLVKTYKECKEEQVDEENTAA